MPNWHTEVPREGLDDPEVAWGWLVLISRFARVAKIPRIGTRWKAVTFGLAVSVQATWTLDDEIADGLYKVRRSR